jgi:hypothetical protein
MIRRDHRRRAFFETLIRGAGWAALRSKYLPTAVRPGSVGSRFGFGALDTGSSLPFQVNLARMRPSGKRGFRRTVASDAQTTNYHIWAYSVSADTIYRRVSLEILTPVHGVVLQKYTPPTSCRGGRAITPDSARYERRAAVIEKARDNGN